MLHAVGSFAQIVSCFLAVAGAAHGQMARFSLIVGNESRLLLTLGWAISDSASRDLQGERGVLTGLVGE